MNKLVMKGELVPCDGVPGCTFIVQEHSRGSYRVTLYSPYGEKHAVDEAVLHREDVFPWLEGRRDY